MWELIIVKFRRIKHLKSMHFIICKLHVNFLKFQHICLISLSLDCIFLHGNECKPESSDKKG